MKSYFAYLGNGCYNYAEEKIDGGPVNIIQKGKKYYFITHASSIKALIKYHQIESLEIYDKVAKLISMNLTAFNSILKNNIVDKGPGLAEVYPNELGGAGAVLKDMHISVTYCSISVGLREDIIFFLDPRNRISEETFQRLLTLTENTLDQIDDIWKTI